MRKRCTSCVGFVAEMCVPKLQNLRGDLLVMLCRASGATIEPANSGWLRAICAAGEEAWRAGVEDAIVEAARPVTLRGGELLDRS
jgi:hypothetical protein